jgi:hypothetical protein
MFNQALLTREELEYTMATIYITWNGKAILASVKRDSHTRFYLPGVSSRKRIARLTHSVVVFGLLRSRLS